MDEVASFFLYYPNPALHGCYPVNPFSFSKPSCLPLPVCEGRVGEEGLAGPWAQRIGLLQSSVRYSGRKESGGESGVVIQAVC